MKLHEHFLERDLKQASKHYSCFQDCLIAVNNHVKDGEIELAKNRATDMVMSLHELTQLSYKKYNQEKYQALMGQLMQQGINMQAVMKYFERM